MPRKGDSKKKLFFVLKNVNTRRIDEVYGISIISNIDSETQTVPPPGSTNISELGAERSKSEMFSFLDESKKNHKCIVAFIDFLSRKKLPSNVDCFWCRNPFTTKALGCPLRYVSPRFKKTYYSEITKDKYTLTSCITKNELEILQAKSEDKNTISNGHYESDGVFCSFNCVMAFIKENKHNPLYSRSKYGEDVKEITCAPHWRLLKQCGGPYSIEKFRDCFGRVEYVDLHSPVRNLPDYSPKFQPVGFLFDERMQF
jgi:hypothetical protein